MSNDNFMNGTFTSCRCTNCSMQCIFSDITDEKFFSQLSENTREITFNKGETIYKQNTFCPHIVFIHEGLVKLIIEGTSGKNLIVRLYASQEYLGLLQPFRKNESRYTAIALKSTKVCMIEVNFFNGLLFKLLQSNERLRGFYSEEIEIINQRLATLGTKSNHGRFADALLYLSEKKLSDESVYSYVSRKDIAELSGISVESMIRLLNEFKSDKIINVKGKHIEINKLDLVNLLSRAG